MQQQKFVDLLLGEISRGNTLKLAVVLWGAGRLSRAERRMFPLLRAIASVSEQLSAVE